MFYSNRECSCNCSHFIFKAAKMDTTHVDVMDVYMSETNAFLNLFP